VDVSRIHDAAERQPAMYYCISLWSDPASALLSHVAVDGFRKAGKDDRQRGMCSQRSAARILWSAPGAPSFPSFFSLSSPRRGGGAPSGALNAGPFGFGCRPLRVTARPLAKGAAPPGAPRGVFADETSISSWPRAALAPPYPDRGPSERPASSSRTGRSAHRAEPRGPPRVADEADPAGAAPAPSSERHRLTPLSERGGRHVYYPRTIVNRAKEDSLRGMPNPLMRGARSCDHNPGRRGAPPPGRTPSSASSVCLVVVPP
jgi:hypothetical protein